MTRISEDARSSRAATAGRALTALALGAWLAISAFHPFTPAVPQLGLDGSWVAVLGEAADRGLRWGVDVAFTYGPASTLVTAYLNAATLTVTLPLLLAACLLFGACTALLVARPRAVPLAEAAATAGLVAAFSRGYPDSVFIALPLLPFLLVLSRDRRGPLATGVAAATAAAVGMVGLAKMSFPLAALPLFLLGDAAAAFRRRPPVLTAPCALGFLLADIVYGQSPADLPAFLRMQWEVVAGYSDAMALGGGRGEVAAYLAASSLLVGATVAVERDAPRRAGSRLAVPAGLAWILLVLFKAGFVRQDTHTLIAWFGLDLALASVAAARFRPARPRLAAAGSLAAVACAALLGLSLVGPAAGTGGRWAGAAAAAWRIIAADPAAELAAAAELARDPAGFARARLGEKTRRRDVLAAVAPLPRLEGGVDVIPSEQGRVIASGLDYRPRPSFQAYSTYTPALVAANRAFVEGPRAPAWVLFGPEPGLGTLSIDGRYPNFAEGGLWLDLLRLYRPGRHIGDLVALRRRDAPAALSLGEPRRSEVGFDETVAVGPAPDGAGLRAIVAAVDVRPTLLGRAASFLYRSPAVTLSVDFADGGTRQYRFVDGIASSGFVLSPMIETAPEFEALADGAAPPPGRVVTGFTLHASPWLRPLLPRRIAVELRPVSGGEPAAAPASAWASLAAAEGVDPAAPDIGTSAPSTLTLKTAGLPRLALGFGLALAEDAPPGAETLCFAVRPADGTGGTLWRRCLDRAREADRGPQSVSLALPPGTSELALETVCGSSCEEGMGGYWAPPP